METEKSFDRVFKVEIVAQGITAQGNSEFKVDITAFPNDRLRSRIFHSKKTGNELIGELVEKVTHYIFNHTGCVLEEVDVLPLRDDSRIDFRAYGNF